MHIAKWCLTGKSLAHNLENYLSVLLAIFPGEPGLTSFIGAKNNGSGGDNWSYKMCKASVKSSPPTKQHPAFFAGQLPFLLPNQQCRCTAAYNFQNNICA